MCQRLRNIFFPTNILGKDIRTIDFSIADVPDINRKKAVTFTWTGERLVFMYTIEQRRYHWDNWNYEEHKDTFTGGGTETYSLQYGPINPSATDYVQDMIYFKCTNVTSLIVNGQQLI